MPSKEIFSNFVSNGFNMTQSDYNQFDTVESNDDLSYLFEVLQSYKDAVGNHPIITANMVVGNPDFNSIRKSNFTKYYYEPVIETLKRYPQRDNVESHVERR